MGTLAQRSSRSSTSLVAPRIRPSRKRIARKVATSSSHPGGAAGGCAFDGAKIALQPITDVVHLIHGPINCEGHSWDSRGAKSSGSTLYRTSFTTAINENDIIFGGEKHLYQADQRDYREIQSAGGLRLSDLCAGHDRRRYQRGLQEPQREIRQAVSPSMSPGFVGSKNLGNKLAGEALLDHVIGTEEPEDTTPYDINIIGEYNLSGELWQVKPLLDELGIRILACISGDAKYHEVARSHRARAAMMVCSKAMINVARKMEERYGIPYFEGSFYGIGDMSDACAKSPPAG